MDHGEANRAQLGGCDPIRQPSGFWRKLGKRFTALSRQYGEIRTEKRDGQWHFIGDERGIEEFKDLAVIAATARGFSGTRDESVGFWCNLLHGHKQREEN